MKNFVHVRLALLAIAILALGILIGGAAYMAQRQLTQLSEHTRTAQDAIAVIYDEFSENILEQNNQLQRYLLRGHKEDWEGYEKRAAVTREWLQRPFPWPARAREAELIQRLRQQHEKVLHEASDLAESRRRGRGMGSNLTAYEAYVGESETLLNLAHQLSDAHRQALRESLVRSQNSLNLLERLVLSSLFLILVLGIWLAVLVYKELIEPLRTKLITSAANLERQEKLASLGILAAGVAHEIRNPLTALKARIFTLKKNLAPDSKQREDAGIIDKEINRLDRIVSDFLLFARPPSPHLMPTSARGALQEVQELLQPQLDTQKIDIEIEPGKDVLVRADPAQLKQVLINLIKNAAESIQGHGNIRLRVTRDQIRQRGRLQPMAGIVIEDNGRGMSSEVQKRLFDPFFSTKDGGTGLGLCLAERIIEKHNGALKYQSQVNRGTVFTILLPREGPNGTNAA